MVSIIFNVRRVPVLRRSLCLLLVLLLLPSACFADSEWAKAKVPKERKPEYIETVSWDELPEPNPGQHHYLLLCLDHYRSIPRPADIKPPRDDQGNRLDFYGNTDGIVILTLDTSAHRITITSIVRDAIISRPDGTEARQHPGRINYIYNDFGPEALCKLISEHLGVRIEKYILFNFSQIVDIVNLECLDGVSVHLTANEIDYLAGYAVPRHTVISEGGYFTATKSGDQELSLHYVTKRNVPLDFVLPLSVFTESGNSWVKSEVSFSGSSGSRITFRKRGECVVTLESGEAETAYYTYDHNRLAVMNGTDVWHNHTAAPGVYHLGGTAALYYMRARKVKNEGTDFMRTQRVRNVLSALADQCRAFSLEEANALANSIMEHDDGTNLNLQEIMDAASTAWSLRDCTIEEFRVPPTDDEVRPIDYAGMAALEINWPAVRAKYHEFLDHTTLTRDIDFIVQD